MTEKRPLLTPKLHSMTPITVTAIQEIRAKTGVARAFRNEELQHWLREVALAYHQNAMGGLPWRNIINHAKEVERTTHLLLTLLERPESHECLPYRFAISRNGMTTDVFLAEMAARLEVLALRAREGIQTLEHQHRAIQDRSDPDCITIGGHLPFVFGILYGQVTQADTPRRGEGRAQIRFVAACCAAFGLQCQSTPAIEKMRVRYKQRHQSEEIRLVPPRHPTPDCAERLAEYYEELAAVSLGHPAG